MNKDSLISKISSKASFSRTKSEQIFDRIFDMIKEELVHNKNFNIEDFGEFKVEHRDTLKVFDKELEQDVVLPPKDFVSFVPSEKLLDTLNKHSFNE